MESLLPHLLAEEADDFRTEDDVLVELLAAKVEEAVLESDVLRLVGLFVGDVEGRHLRGRLHHELVRLDLDLACWQLGIDRVGSPQFHLARHGDDGLEVRLFDEAEEAAGRVNDDLREAVVVAEVHEEDAAVVAEAEHPAGKSDGLARVGGAELVACVCTIGMHQFSPEKLPYYTINWRTVPRRLCNFSERRPVLTMH